MIKLESHESGVATGAFEEMGLQETRIAEYLPAVIAQKGKRILHHWLRYLNRINEK